MKTNAAKLPEWMRRWVPQRQSASPSAAPSSLMSSRVEVCPPELWPSSLTWGGRLKRMLVVAPWVPDRARPVNRLALAKAEFSQLVGDVAGHSGATLADSIARARSLRELWHLRLPVYGAVAMAHSQAEAERRLTLLNRHFPMRAPHPASLTAAG